MFGILEDDWLNDKEKTLKILYLFKLPPTTDINIFIDDIQRQRFISTTGKNDAEKSFDYLRDYDLIWALILEKWHINLNVQDCYWWEFTSMIECLMQTENALTIRIGYRTWQKRGKHFNYDAYNNKINMNLKLQYQLSQSVEYVQKQLGKIFNSLKNKGG